MRELNGMDWLAMILVIIGGLNWGLLGFFRYNIIAGIFGDMTAVSRVIYALVGLSALYLVFTLPAFVRRGRREDVAIHR